MLLLVSAASALFFPTIVDVFTVSLQLSSCIYEFDWPVNNRLHIQHESFNYFREMCFLEQEENFLW